MNDLDDGYRYDQNEIRQSEIFTICLGSISIVFPASVVFILLSRYNTLLKGRPLTLLILMIGTILLLLLSIINTTSTTTTTTTTIITTTTTTTTN